MVKKNMKLNVGCGTTILEGWVNLDIYPIETTEHFVQHDIRKGLPFEDNTFEAILCDNVCEHLTPGHPKDGGKFVFVLNELYRICKPGGIVMIIVPHRKSAGAVQDPTHVSFFDPRSWLYWNQESAWTNHTGITADFDLVKQEVYGDMSFETETFIKFTLRAREKK